MPFRAALGELFARHGRVVRGAVFCDDEGERVEAVIHDPALDPYELDIIGASYASLWPVLTIKDEAQLRVLHRERVVWLQSVSHGYYVAVVACRDGTDHAIAPSLRAVGLALREHL